MPGTPATSPRFGAPRFANADAVDFAGQVNGVTDAFDLNAARLADLDPLYADWRTDEVGGGTASNAVVASAATFIIPGGRTNYAPQGLAAVSGALTAGYAFKIDPAKWWPATTRTKQIMVEWQVQVNAVAPAVTLTCGLYKVNAFGGASGADPTVTSLAAVTAGTTAVFTTPAATSNVATDSSVITAPAAGDYVFAVASSGAMAANSRVVIKATLKRRAT